MRRSRQGPWQSCFQRIGCWTVIIMISVLIGVCFWLFGSWTGIKAYIWQYRANRWLDDIYNGLPHATSDEPLYTRPPETTMQNSTHCVEGTAHRDFGTDRAYDDVLADYQRFFFDRGYKEVIQDSVAIFFVEDADVLREVTFEPTIDYETAYPHAYRLRLRFVECRCIERPTWGCQ